MSSYLLLTDFMQHRAGSILSEAVGDPIMSLARSGASLLPMTPAIEGAAQRIKDANRGHLPEDLGALLAALAGPAGVPVEADGVARVYVSLGGDDRSHGLDVGNPVASVQAAMDRVDRASRGGQVSPFEVVLGAGTHVLGTTPLRLTVEPIGGLVIVGPSSGLAVAATGTVTAGDSQSITRTGSAWTPHAFDSYAVEVFNPADEEATRQHRTARSNGTLSLGVTRPFDTAPEDGWTYFVRVPTAVIALVADPVTTDLFGYHPGTANRGRLNTSHVRVVVGL